MKKEKVIDKYNIGYHKMTKGISSKTRQYYNYSFKKFSFKDLIYCYHITLVTRSISQCHLFIYESQALQTKPKKRKRKFSKINHSSEK